MILKVIHVDHTPKNCRRRVILRHSESTQWWPRVCGRPHGKAFPLTLWSNPSFSDRAQITDDVYDRNTNKFRKAKSPFLDNWKPKAGHVVLPVSINVNGNPRFSIYNGFRPYADFPAFLYCTQRQWLAHGDSTPWRLTSDGRPEPLLAIAVTHEARRELRTLNLHAQGQYYYAVVQTLESGFGGYWKDESTAETVLTDNPTKDCKYPLGIPVVTGYDSIVGVTYSQNGYVLKQAIPNGKFVNLDGDGPRLVRPEDASVWESYDALGRKAATICGLGRLTILDESAVWDRFPECHGDPFERSNRELYSFLCGVTSDALARGAVHIPIPDTDTPFFSMRDSRSFL